MDGRCDSSCFDNLRSDQFDNARSLSADVWNHLSLPSMRMCGDAIHTLHFNTTELYQSSNSIHENWTSSIKSVLSGVSKIIFTSPDLDRATGQQPDFFLGRDGSLRMNPARKPSGDGVVTIEVQSQNKFDTDAKKLAHHLQKATIKDLISYFRRSNPQEKIPQDWLDLLDMVFAPRADV